MPGMTQARLVKSLQNAHEQIGACLDYVQQGNGSGQSAGGPAGSVATTTTKKGAKKGTSSQRDRAKKAPKQPAQ